MTDSAPTHSMPRSLLFMLLLYGGSTVVAGILAAKQVALPFGLAVEAGIFAFLILVVISSTISQLYGDRLANRIVWWGFVPLAVSTGLLLFVLHLLPPSAEMVRERPEVIAAFELIHNQTWRIWMAGPAAYLISLLLNVWLFSKLRGSGNDGTVSIMVRGAIASALSQAIDSVIFITLAFYGVFEIRELLLGQMLAKVVLSLVLVPFLITGFVQFARWLDSKPA